MSDTANTPADIPADIPANSPADTPVDAPTDAPSATPATTENGDSAPATGLADLKPTVTIEDFAKLDLRIADVVAVEDHPKADRLIVLTIDLGGETRTLVAGIKPFLEDPATLVGTRIVVVANLEPAKLRGIESQGMLLAAGGRNGAPFGVLSVSADVPAGTRVS